MRKKSPHVKIDIVSEFSIYDKNSCFFVIIIMKAFFVFVLLLSNSFLISGYTLSLSENKIELKIDEDKIVYNNQNNTVSIDTSLLKYGGVGEAGLNYLSSSPFSSASLIPQISQSNKEKIVILSPFYFIDGNRKAFGLFFNNEVITFNSMVAEGKEDNSYIKESLYRTNLPTIWFGIEGKYDRFKVRFLSSIASDFACSSLLFINVGFSIFSFTFSKGKIESYSGEESQWENMYSLKMEGESFKTEHTLYYADKPFYSFSYRAVMYRVYSELRSGDFVFIDSLEKHFVDGKENRKERFSIKYKNGTVGFDTSNGLFFSCKRDSVKIDYEKGKPTLTIVFSFKNENKSVEIEISNSNKTSIKVAISG